MTAPPHKAADETTAALRSRIVHVVSERRGGSLETCVCSSLLFACPDCGSPRCLHCCPLGELIAAECCDEEPRDA